jgi:hypothetical protein
MRRWSLCYVDGVGRERIVLVMHTTAYAVEAFVAAARRVGVGLGIDLDVVLASDRCPILDRAWDWPKDSWVIDFYDPDGAADVIAAGAAADPDAPVRAVLPVGGEGPARVAALAAQRIGLDGRDPDAVARRRWRCRASWRRGSTSCRSTSRRASPSGSAGPACSSRCCCRPAAA